MRASREARFNGKIVHSGTARGPSPEGMTTGA
jgi:hypothetical protein